MQGWKESFNKGNGYQKATIIVVGIFATLALFQWVLTIVCVIMVALDKRVDAQWNCGVVIHGFLAIVMSAVTFITGLFYKLLCWKY